MARRQHGVAARSQLLALGFGAEAIRHRLERGRLHGVHRGVYAVGRPEITHHGRLMAAVLACGPGALISHRSAAELWGIASHRPRKIELSVPSGSRYRPGGCTVHRRDLAPDERTLRHRIPLTATASTLVDLAAGVDRPRLEAAVNEADKLDLLRADELPGLVARFSGRPGLRALRALVEARSFRLTDSELERRFLALVHSAGLPAPETGHYLSGFRVDFFWPLLGLVVETDGLRYHRTPGQQARDRLRDQTHVASGLTALRFTHAQVRFEPAHVRATLRAVMRRLNQPKR